MTLKLLTILLLSNVLFSLTSCGNNNQGGVKEIFNVDSKVELLFFFKKDTSALEKQSLNKTIDDNYVLVKTGQGYVPGPVQAVFGIDKSGYEGFGITFRPTATEIQREEVKGLLKGSPLVHKVYENVVPNELKETDLQGSKVEDQTAPPPSR